MSTDPDRRKALAFALTLGGALLLAEAAKPRRRTDPSRSGVPLGSIFPAAFGDWRLDGNTPSFVAPADEQGKLYGVYDQVLERAYVGPQGERVMLAVAYGSEQSPALQVHRPEVCYKAGGYQVRDVHRATLEVGSRRLPVTRLHASVVGRSEPVTYWTVLGDAVIGESSRFGWERLRATLAGEIRDGMLVRVSSIDHDAARSYRLHQRFATDLARVVSASYTDRVFGSAR